jgi:hypothetical protein
MNFFKLTLQFSLILGLLLCTFVKTQAKDIEIINSLQNENRVLNTPVDLHLSDADNPMVNSTIDIVSGEAWLFFDNMKPSEVMDRYSASIKINGVGMNPYETANCRIVVYKQGAVVIPHPAGYQPLETFSGANFVGDTQKHTVDQYYTNSPVSDIPEGRVEGLEHDNSIRSFKLKRGYMVTLANETDGMGYSRVFIADEEDLEISQLPAELDQKVSFIRVFPWEWVSKKGWVGTFDDNQPEGLKYVDEQSDITNSTWYYTWGASVYGSANATETTLINQEFVPEKWGKGGNVHYFYENKRWSHLVGQNEPDHTEQSNVTVEEAVAEWPILMKTGARLGSPATTDFNWLYNFMDQCEKNNYRVDFVVVHAYWGGKSASNWYKDLKKVHDITGRPLWIKEWNNGANWTNESWPSSWEDQQKKQLNDLKGILNVMDTASFIERYSIYNWVEDKRAILLNGELTPAGEYYASTIPGFAFNRDKEVIPAWTMLKPRLSYNFSEETGKINLAWEDPNGELTAKNIIEQSVDKQQTWDKVTEISSPYIKNHEVDVLAPGEAQGGEVYYRIRTIGPDNAEKSSNIVKYDFLKNTNGALVTADNIKVKEDWSMFFFENPVSDDITFIVGPPTYRNRYPLTVRARNVNNKSFEMQMRTWNYLEEPQFAYPDTMAFMAIPEGVHRFGEITLLAGKELQVGKAWKTVTFEQPFSLVPVVLATQISANDNTASAIRIKNVTKTGFDVCRKYEPAQPNVFEDISFIAATPGSGTIDDLTTIEVGTWGLSGTSYSKAEKINYANTYEKPAFFAFMQTCNDETPSILRMKSRGKNYAEVFKEREKSSSTTLKSEEIGWIVVGSNVTTGSTVRKKDDLQPVFDPISNKIRLNGSQLMKKAEVFSMHGIRIISETNVHDLDVAFLKKGIYIVRINNASSMKFIKQ